MRIFKLVFIFSLCLPGVICAMSNGERVSQLFENDLLTQKVALGEKLVNYYEHHTMQMFVLNKCAATEFRWVMQYGSPKEKIILKFKGWEVSSLGGASDSAELSLADPDIISVVKNTAHRKLKDKDTSAHEKMVYAMLANEPAIAADQVEFLAPSVDDQSERGIIDITSPEGVGFYLADMMSLYEERKDEYDAAGCAQVLKKIAEQHPDFFSQKRTDFYASESPLDVLKRSHEKNRLLSSAYTLVRSAMSNKN